jgi:cellulose synthase (UDP-forming)
MRLVQSRPAQAATVLYIAASLAYLYWRVAYTVNTDALFVSIPFLFADFAGFGYFLLFAHNLWRRTERTPPAAPEGLTVDVFIPTYNEDLAVLRPTIEAALAMDHPHETYVLDDGRRETVKQLCRQLGVRYLTRPDNKGAKAGNINAALPRTDGEFIAFFDADHAPFRNFLTELLGYFNDPKVALVQAPQAYYNLDSFQHARTHGNDAGSPWHEQSVFYDAMMPGKDRLNAAFWCGSSAILRRTALEEVGGVDTRTVTEDMHTTMSLHAAGWRSVYDSRELALGIAPDDASGFLVQRQRWAQGALQVLRKDNPLKKPGLTLGQRLAYFAGVAYVFEYIPRLIYLLTPISALLVGELPMKSVGWDVLSVIVAFWIFGVLTSRLLTLGRNPFLQAEQYHLLKLTIMLRAMLTSVWPRPLKFKVTPKAGDGKDHLAAELSHIGPQLAVGGLSAIAAVWAGLGYVVGAPWELSGGSLLVTSAWAIFNAGLVASVAHTILRRHHRRALYRFQVELPGSLSSEHGQGIVRIVDLSALGVGWESALEIPRGAPATLQFTVGEARVTAKLLVQSRRETSEGFRYGGEFIALADTAQRDLVLFLYQQHAPAMFGPAQSPGPREELLKAS